MKYKDAKIFENQLKPCHIGIRQIALTEYSQLSTLQDMATVPTVLATTVPWWPGRLGAMLPVIRTP